MVLGELWGEDVFEDLKSRFGDSYTHEIFRHEVGLYNERVVCHFIPPAVVRDAQIAAIARIHENQES